MIWTNIRETTAASKYYLAASYFGKQQGVYMVLIENDALRYTARRE
jgi:hypothetical protein